MTTRQQFDTMTPKLRKMVRSGNPTADIAAAFGVTVATVGNWIRRIGEPPRPRGRRIGQVPQCVLDRQAAARKQLTQMYVTDAMSITAIAGELGVTRQAIRARLTFLDICRETRKGK